KDQGDSSLRWNDDLVRLTGDPVDRRRWQVTQSPANPFLLEPEPLEDLLGHRAARAVSELIKGTVLAQIMEGAGQHPHDLARRHAQQRQPAHPRPDAARRIE